MIAYFRKYARPTRLFSRNSGRNRTTRSQLDRVVMLLYYSQKVLLGGNGGIAPLELGKVADSFLRKSSKSEYLGIVSRKKALLKSKA